MVVGGTANDHQNGSPPPEGSQGKEAKWLTTGASRLLQFFPGELQIGPPQANSQPAHPPRKSRIPTKQGEVELVRKAVLCIAYFFPPDAHSGTHRTRGLVRHLSRSEEHTSELKS